jgi:hypothetical protein
MRDESLKRFHGPVWANIYGEARTSFYEKRGDGTHEKKQFLSQTNRRK